MGKGWCFFFFLGGLVVFVGSCILWTFCSIGGWWRCLMLGHLIRTEPLRIMIQLGSGPQIRRGGTARGGGRGRSWWRHRHRRWWRSIGARCCQGQGCLLIGAGQESGGELGPLLLPHSQLKGAEVGGRWGRRRCRRSLIQMWQQHLRVRRSSKHLQVLAGFLQQRHWCGICLLRSQLGHQRIGKESQGSSTHVLVEEERIHGIPGNVAQK